MTTQVARPDPLVAPIVRGQSMGHLQVLLDQKVFAEIPLVALSGVEQSGVLGRAWDAIRLWIK
jgi:D-alanyl-D-alanine carboxypeptidase (penicillin-binding protein 5/6)